MVQESCFSTFPLVPCTNTLISAPWRRKDVLIMCSCLCIYHVYQITVTSSRFVVISVLIKWKLIYKYFTVEPFPYFVFKIFRTPKGCWSHSWLHNVYTLYGTSSRSLLTHTSCPWWVWIQVVSDIWTRILNKDLRGQVPFSSMIQIFLSEWLVMPNAYMYILKHD